jgi:hypothetical protein
MPTPTVLLQGLLNPVGLRVHPAANRVFVAQKNGKIFTVDLATPLLTQVGNAPGAVNDLDVTGDGKMAYVVGDLLGLTEVDLKGGPSRRLIRRMVRPRCVLRDPATETFFITEGAAPGRLFSISLSPAQMNVKARGLTSPRGIVLERATGRMIVAESAAGGRLVEPALVGPAAVLADGLGAPIDLSWFADDQTQLIVADAAGKRVLLIDLTTPGAPPTELFTGVDQLWGARSSGSGKVVIGAGDALLLGDLTLVERDQVKLHVPSDKLFIAGWVKVPVTINDPAIAFDDLEYQIEPKNSAAMVSYSRDNSFDASKPDILLSAGWLTGEHELFVLHRPTGRQLGKTTFNVLDNWTDPKLGPSLATFGSVISGPSGGTWGGPDSGDFKVPQNVMVTPALGTRKVGVVLVDTDSARYPTDAALNTIIADLRNEMLNGVNVGGKKRSVAEYFSRASDGMFQINLVGIVGPINLQGNWNSYFTMNGTQWVLNEDVDSTVIAQLVELNLNARMTGNAPVLDLSQMDTLIYVFRSVSSTPPNPADRFVWPRATLQTKTQLVDYQFDSYELPIYRGIARITMPDDWAARESIPASAGAVPSRRQFHETVSHEMGHNLGLVDQYTPVVANPDGTRRIADRNEVGGTNNSWELMSWERDLPLPSAAHRLILGWLRKDWVKLYNPGIVGRVDETITLYAASIGRPPAGSYGAAEVRIEDGKNYYFEYRPNTGSIVDPNPPEINAVLGTEAEFRSSKLTNKPNILLVQEDPDAVVDRGAFAAGEDYRDTDTSSGSTFTNEFIVDVVNTTADAATVRVRYAADDKPDPQLTPWSPSSNWQSPDIEVINGRSVENPETFRNIPWEGHDNTVVARVRNGGTSIARGVTVRFFYKDFTLDGGDEHPLGEQKQDIPAGGQVTFTAPEVWKPALVWYEVGLYMSQQHACLIARIEPFFDPVSKVWEVTPENNEAMSNYTWMASTFASPATREVTAVGVQNTFDQPAYVYFTVHQPHPLFRTYLDHRWVHLKPRESKQILVMVEALYGDKRFDELTQRFQHGERRVATTLRLTALGDTRQTCTATVMGGVSILAITGVDTHFKRFEAHDGHAKGEVVRTDTGDGVDGKVLISILPEQPDERRSEIVHEVQAVGGQFFVQVPTPQQSIIQAHFLGGFPFGPSDSKVVRV